MHLIVECVLDAEKFVMHFAVGGGEAGIQATHIAAGAVGFFAGAH